MTHLDFEPFAPIRASDCIRLTAIASVGLVVIAGACVFWAVVAVSE